MKLIIVLGICIFGLICSVLWHKYIHPRNDETPIGLYPHKWRSRSK